MMQPSKNSRLRKIDFQPLHKGMTDRTLWGGKTVGLAQILAAGLRLPETVCVPCDALSLRDVSPEAIAVMDLQLGALPDPITVYLRNPGLVVRSSSILEDGTTQSGAGKYKTVIGVTSEDALIRGIKECWGAAYLSSRPTETISKSEQAMGLIIQQLVPCDVSGIAFSKDPLGKRSGTIIEAGWGNCSALVDGRIEPDTYTVQAQSIETRVGAKAHYDLVSDGKFYTLGTPDDLQTDACLNNAEAREIASYVEFLAEMINCDVDVEWGISNSIVFLFQCRAITTI